MTNLANKIPIQIVFSLHSTMPNWMVWESDLIVLLGIIFLVKSRMGTLFFVSFKQAINLIYAFMIVGR